MARRSSPPTYRRSLSAAGTCHVSTTEEPPAMALPLQFSRPAEHTVSRSLSDQAALGTLLRDHLVPQAIARNFQTRTLAIWSAGCADGSELFDIAVLLQEHFPALA